MRDVTLLDTEHKVSISIDNETQEIDIKKIKKLYTYIDLNESLNTALENDIVLDAYIYCSNEPPTTINENTEVNEENVTHRDIIDSDGTVVVTIYNGDSKYYEENVLFKQGHIIHAIPNDLPLGTYEMSIEYLGGKYFEPYTLDVFFDIEKRLGTCTFDKEIYYGNLGDTISIQGILTDKERGTPVKDCMIKYEFNKEEDQEVTTHIDGDFYIHVQIPEPDIEHCYEFSKEADESETEIGDPYQEEYDDENPFYTEITKYEDFFDEDGNIIQNHTNVESSEYQNQIYVSAEEDQNCLWFDKGTITEHKNTWYNLKENGEYVLKVDYPPMYNATRVRKTEENNTQRYYYYNDDTISTTKIGNYNSITSPSVIEFDVLSHVGTIQLSLYDGTTHVIQQISANGHYRIETDGFFVTFYHNKTEIPDSKKAFTGENYRFGFGFSAQNEGIVFRNFIIHRPIYDFIWTDKGTITEHKNSWYNYESLLTVDYPTMYDATRVRKLDVEQRYYYYNDDAISSKKIGSCNSITTPSVIEFDVLSYVGTIQLSLYDGTNQVIQEISANGHYKIECDGSVVKFYKDDIQITNNSNTLTGTHYRFGFGFNENSEGVVFKDFIIRLPNNIIETYKDDEYSVETYITEADESKFLWVDKGTSSEHKTTWYNLKKNDEYVLKVEYPEQYNATRIIKEEDNNTQRYYYYNDSTLSTNKIGGYYAITTPSVIEFDVLSYAGTIQLSLYDGENEAIQNISGNGHYKIECDGFNAVFYKNGTRISTDQKILKGPYYRFGFGFNEQNECIVFKNFIVRSFNLKYLWTDKGTTALHKDSWYNYNNALTVDYPVQYNGTRVRKLEDDDTQRYYYYNDTAISTTKINGYNTITTPSIIEFDVLSYVGTIQLSLYDGENQVIQEISGNGHYKIECDNSIVKFYKDGAEISNSQGILTGTHYRFGFGFSTKNEGIVFKNFVVRLPNDTSPYENVFDADGNIILWADKGTSSQHKTTWYNYKTLLTVDYPSLYGGTRVRKLDTPQRYYYYNDTAISTTKVGGYNSIVTPSIIEFDILSRVGTIQLSLYNGTTHVIQEISSNGHYKIECNGSTVVFYKDGIEIPNSQKTFTGDNYRFGFGLNEIDEGFVFKNFTIHSPSVSPYETGGAFLLIEENTPTDDENILIDNSNTDYPEDIYNITYPNASYIIKLYTDNESYNINDTEVIVVANKAPTQVVGTSANKEGEASNILKINGSVLADYLNKDNNVKYGKVQIELPDYNYSEKADINNGGFSHNIDLTHLYDLYNVDESNEITTYNTADDMHPNITITSDNNKVSVGDTFIIKAKVEATAPNGIQKAVPYGVLVFKMFKQGTDTLVHQYATEISTTGEGTFSFNPTNKINYEISVQYIGIFGYNDVTASTRYKVSVE